MTTSLKFFRITMMAGAVSASMLASRYAHATHWVTGTSQTAAPGKYFTEVSASFTVPPAPKTVNGQLPFSMWPGLYDASDGDLIQPVLAWDNTINSATWTMHNEVATVTGTGRPPGFSDTLFGVSPNDTIWEFVYLDQNNEGANCKLATGNNCNYTASFVDLNSGASAVLSRDWTMKQGPTIALGVVFEANSSVYDTCTDFPTAGIADYSYVYQNGSSGLYTQIAGNFTAHWPGNDSPWPNGTFTTPSVGTGGNVFGNCINIAAITGNEAVLFLNSF